MSGEHTHPDYLDEHASLRADLVAAAARLLALERQVAALAGGRVAGHREYTGDITDRVEFPIDGAWHDIPGFPPFTGSPFVKPDETHSLYVRLYPEWGPGPAAALEVEVRYVRANGDPTAHDSEQYAPGTDSIPFRSYHDEYGEQGVGGRFQLRMTGGATKVVLSTRYAKLRAFAVDWT